MQKIRPICGICAVLMIICVAVRAGAGSATCTPPCAPSLVTLYGNTNCDEPFEFTCDPTTGDCTVYIDCGWIGAHHYTEVWTTYLDPSEFQVTSACTVSVVRSSADQTHPTDNLNLQDSVTVTVTNPNATPPDSNPLPSDPQPTIVDP
jgi:hypothetical protein